MINKIFFKYILCILLVYCSTLSNALPKDNLDVFAFNVGQANFNVLKTNSGIVIMDAGIRQSVNGSDNIGESFVAITENRPITAVFISHPHTDHYNLIEYLQAICANQFTGTFFYLGGTQQHWNTRVASQFILRLDQKKYSFLSDGFLGGKLIGLNFKVFELGNVSKLTGNSLSQIIQVTYKNRTILFTGDANAQTLQHMGYLGINIKNIGDNGDENDDENPKILGGVTSAEVIQVLKSDIVFMPHHGSDSSGSNIFHSLATNAISIICSDPKSTHSLPKQATLLSIIQESNYIPIQNMHSVCHYITQAPVYLTSASNMYYKITIGQNLCGIWDNLSTGYYNGGSKRGYINSFDNPTSRLISLFNIKKIYEKVYDIDLDVLRNNAAQKGDILVEGFDKKIVSLWLQKLKNNIPYLLNSARNITVRLKGNNTFISAYGKCFYKTKIVRNKCRLVSVFTDKEDEVSQAIQKKLKKQGEFFNISNIVANIEGSLWTYSYSVIEQK